MCVGTRRRAMATGVWRRGEVGVRWMHSQLKERDIERASCPCESSQAKNTEQRTPVGLQGCLWGSTAHMLSDTIPATWPWLPEKGISPPTQSAPCTQEKPNRQWGSSRSDSYRKSILTTRPLVITGPGLPREVPGRGKEYKKNMHDPHPHDNNNFFHSQPFSRVSSVTSRFSDVSLWRVKSLCTWHHTHPSHSHLSLSTHLRAGVIFIKQTGRAWWELETNPTAARRWATCVLVKIVENLCVALSSKLLLNLGFFSAVHIRNKTHSSKKLFALTTVTFMFQEVVWTWLIVLTAVITAAKVSKHCWNVPFPPSEFLHQSLPSWLPVVAFCRSICCCD